MSNKESNNSNNEPTTLKELHDLFQIVSAGKQVWEATFDAIVDPVLIVSKNFLIERANLAAAKAVNLDVRELIGKKCYEVFAKREASCVGCPMIIGFQSHAPERNRLTPYSDHREYIASSFPIRSKNGEDLGMVVLQYQDLSRIRKLEEQLLQNEKMAAIGLFASGIAHDINNPLSGVLAFAQLAMQGLDLQSQTYQDLQEIETSALRCKKIIEELLLLTRPSSQTEKSFVDLSHVVERVLPNLKVQWRDFDYALKVELKKLTPVLVCETKFEQVLMNLLTNAFQALRPGDEISIRCGEDAENVFVEIQDSGRGISPQHLSKIFDPYFTTKAQHGGTGLGLPICYNIVREHGGHLRVQSVEGKGSIFQVYIPKGGKS